MNRILTTTSATFADWTQAQMPFLKPSPEVMFFDADNGTKWGEQRYHEIIYAKHERIASMLCEMPAGALLLYTDADVIFFEDTTELFKIATDAMDQTGAEVIGADDPDSGLCAGFMVIRASAQTRDLFAQVWANRNSRENDQLCLNRLLGGFRVKFAAHLVGNYATHCRTAVWDGEPFRVACKPRFAWHCNYTIGHEAKQRMRQIVLAQVSGS